jgi:hypothetical protein
MKPEQVHSLLEAYHDGTLNDADARKLASAIEAGDETSCLIMDEMEFSGLLSTALEDFDGEGFVRGLEEKFRAQTNAGAFTENFQERVRAANIGKPESIGRKTNTCASHPELTGVFASPRLRRRWLSWPAGTGSSTMSIYRGTIFHRFPHWRLFKPRMARLR